MLTLQKALGPGLTKGDLEKFNREINVLKKEGKGNEDTLSEFSVITDESEI